MSLFGKIGEAVGGATSTSPIGMVLGIGGKIIDRVIPDKNAAASAKAALVDMQAKGELDEMTGQLEINKVEAASNSTFVAGWRPFVGWVCGSAMAYGFIGQPFIVTLIAVVQCIMRHQTFDKSMLPIIDMSQMWPVLLGMLGMGALRSLDKLTGPQQGSSNGH